MAEFRHVGAIAAEIFRNWTCPSCKMAGGIKKFGHGMEMTCSFCPPPRHPQPPQSKIRNCQSCGVVDQGGIFCTECSTPYCAKCNHGSNHCPLCGQ